MATVATRRAELSSIKCNHCPGVSHSAHTHAANPQHSDDCSIMVLSLPFTHCGGKFLARSLFRVCNRRDIRHPLAEKRFHPRSPPHLLEGLNSLAHEIIPANVLRRSSLHKVYFRLHRRRSTKQEGHNMRKWARTIGGQRKIRPLGICLFTLSGGE